jgi:2-dehydro-3-deoxyphosphogluconate aldolase/(4S)-4-hydroxy-2-oxoglutarate aldolase
VDIETAPEFIKAGATAVAVGGALIDAKTLSEGPYESLIRETKEFLRVIHEAKKSHQVGTQEL